MSMTLPPLTSKQCCCHNNTDANQPTKAYIEYNHEEQKKVSWVIGAMQSLDSPENTSNGHLASSDM